MKTNLQEKAMVVAIKVGDDPSKVAKLLLKDPDFVNYKENIDIIAKNAILSVEGLYCKNVMIKQNYVEMVDSTKGPKYSISAPLLSDYIHKYKHYFYVRNPRDTSGRFFVYKNGVYQYFSDEALLSEIKKYIDIIDPKITSLKLLRDVLGLLKTYPDVKTDEDINSDCKFINFENGLLNIETGELLPHSFDVLSTVQIPCNWNQKATSSPVFDKFLDDISSGDKQVKQFLLQFIGAIFSNVESSKYKKALFMVGPGNTGKSQLKSLVEKIVGKQNCTAIDLIEIEERFGKSALYGKRLAGSSDMSFMKIRELKTFKKLTGGDTITAEFKNVDKFDFTYKGFLWFCMNELPKFGGDDGSWVYDRIIPIQCTNVISYDKQDKCLLEKMFSEREAIVVKAINEFKKTVSNNFTFDEPDSTYFERSTYQIENNTVYTFINECLEPLNDNNDETYSVQQIYDAYRAWCKNYTNSHTKSFSEFRRNYAEYMKSDYCELVYHTRNARYLKHHQLNVFGQECLNKN